MTSTKQILKRLTFFSIPLILSGLLQQLFNWVDALIVGNILGETALAVVAFLLTAVIMLLGKTMLSMFGLTAESVAIGERFFHTIAIFYIVYGVAMSIKGYLDGIADMLFTGITGILSLGVRLLCSYAFVKIWGNMVVAYAEAFSWIFLFAVFTVRFLYKTKKK